MRGAIRLLLLAGSIFSSAAFADWIADSNRYAMQVLRAQGAFVPESVTGNGLSAFDADIIDLRADYQVLRLHAYHGLANRGRNGAGC